MFVSGWILFVGFFISGNGLSHQTRHERTRYVSSRNQIYGDSFNFDDKRIPFVHFWEKPLQVLENSMKIPKKLSSRPLFSWDLPVAVSTYTTSRKTTENPITESNLEVEVPKTIQRSRSDRAKASVLYPDSFIPVKKKKSGNTKKSIEGSEKLKEFVEGKKDSVRLDLNGKIKRKKKVKKNRKGKLDGKRRKSLGKIKEMNDQVNEVLPKVIQYQERETLSACEMKKDRCEHGCRELDGKATCICYKGFTLQGEKCIDVNECETNNGGCNGKCVNTIGSRKCICLPGFRLVDGVCADINECLLRNGHGPCQDQCINTLGGYYCSCDNLPGTTLSRNNHTCEKNNNCNKISTGCSHSCVTLSGRTFCTCPDGLELGSDWKTCQDIDECLNPEDYDVRCEFGCVNTVGSYLCASQNETMPAEGNSA